MCGLQNMLLSVHKHHSTIVITDCCIGGVGGGVGGSFSVDQTATKIILMMVVQEWQVLLMGRKRHW